MIMPLFCNLNALIEYPGASLPLRVDTGQYIQTLTKEHNKITKLNWSALVTKGLLKYRFESFNNLDP